MFYFRPRFVSRRLRQMTSRLELERLACGALSLVKLELAEPDSHDVPV